ncbi:Uncharacterized protein SCF082_LOCUS32595, partial [Durusdinium trenchii]
RDVSASAFMLRLSLLEERFDREGLVKKTITLIFGSRPHQRSPKEIPSPMRSLPPRSAAAAQTFSAPWLLLILRMAEKVLEVYGRFGFCVYGWRRSSKRPMAAGVAQMTTAGPPPDLMEFRNCKIKAPMASDYEDTFWTNRARRLANAFWHGPARVIAVQLPTTIWLSPPPSESCAGKDTTCRLKKRGLKAPYQRPRKVAEKNETSGQKERGLGKWRNGRQIAVHMCGDAPDDEAQRGGKVEVPTPDTNFSLPERMVGISSYAPASKFSNRRLTSLWLNVQKKYWPIRSNTCPSPQEAHEYQMGDGGAIDNSGLLPLLQRGSRKERVIWIASSYRPLQDYDFEGATGQRVGCLATIDNFDPHAAGVVDQLSSLFGYGLNDQDEGYFYGNNQGLMLLKIRQARAPQRSSYKCTAGQTTIHQGLVTSVVETRLTEDCPQMTIEVFKKSQLLPICRKLFALKSSGKPMVLKESLDVLPNSYWGIRGAHQVSFVLIYLDKCAEFQQQLPQEVQDEIAKGPHGMLENYPIYRTLRYSRALFGCQLLEWCQSMSELFLGAEWKRSFGGWGRKRSHADHMEPESHCVVLDANRRAR